MKTWTAQNKLKLNDDKAEALLMKSNRTSLRADAAEIPFTTCARNLGFMISDNMNLDKHISAVCRSAYVKIRRISSIRQYLTVKAIKTLICWTIVILFCLAARFIFSSADYKRF